MVSIRFSGSKSWIWNRPKCIGPCASNDDLSVNLPESSAIAMVKALKVEPISYTPVVSRLMRVGSSASMRIVGIVIRLRNHGDDLAGAHVEDDAGGGQRLEFGARGDQLVAQRMLHAQIDGELDRSLQPVGGKPRHMQRGEAMPVEPLLHAGDALVVDIDVAEKVRNLGAVRIVAFVLVQEADARQALTVDLALLLGRDVALEPDEAALGGQPFAQLCGVEIGQVCGEELDRFVHIDQPPRFGVERGHAHVGGQNFAVAVEDVGTRRRDRIAGDDAVRRTAVGYDRKHDQPHGNDEIHRGEGDDRQAQPRSRFGGAIDLAAGKGSAREPPPPRVSSICPIGCSSGALRDRCHRSSRPEFCRRRLRFVGTVGRRGGRRRDASRRRIGLFQIFNGGADRIGAVGLYESTADGRAADRVNRTASATTGLSGR